MIDPDNITISEKNLNTDLTLKSIPPYDFITWDLENDKELKKFLSAVEKEVRKSFEYREMISFIRDNYNMNECAFIKVDNKETFDIKIEIHHYPFTLYDITEIVYRKRIYYQESLELQLVAKEITMLHYRLLVGLIPLSKTVHQLVHDGKQFIPVQNVLGRYDLFVDLYKDFCTEEQLETLERIKEYSNESDLCNSTMLDQNQISFDVLSPEFQLPDLSNMSNSMEKRISDIKKNNYKLPKYDDYKTLEKKDDISDRKIKIKPIFFYKNKDDNPFIN